MNLFTIALAFVINAVGNANSSHSEEEIRSRSITALPTTVNKTILLQLVNDVRRKGCKCGDTYYYPVSAVQWNDQLALAAFHHSEDMYQKKYFAHLAPDGSKGGTRIERTGYQWRAFGENIATGYKTEREVVQGWIKSPGHCKNIMNKLFKEMGIARFGNYWTQEFGTRWN